MIDTLSPPGSFRAALAPNANCAACRQSLCDHPDAIYAGVAPPIVPAPVCDPAAGSFLHSSPNSAGAQHDHA